MAFFPQDIIQHSRHLRPPGRRLQDIVLEQAFAVTLVGVARLEPPRFHSDDDHLHVQTAGIRDMVYLASGW
jgi:hypothetical protein